MATAEQLRVMHESVNSARNRRVFENERIVKNRSAMAVSSTHRGVSKTGVEHKTISIHRRNKSNSLSPMNIYSSEKHKTTITAHTSRNISKSRQKKQQSSGRDLPSNFKKSPYNLNLQDLPEKVFRKKQKHRDISSDRAYINAVDYLP